jgi:hypothetical protein
MPFPTETPFHPRSNPETLYLRSGNASGDLTGYIDEESFGASETDISMGRYRKSTGAYNFVSLDSRTPGDENALPLVDPVVITEIMYHPHLTATDTYDAEQYEYIELYNTAATVQNLWVHDVDKDLYLPWKFVDGIDYTFPAYTQIQPGEHILLVKNPEAFIERYGDPTVRTFGPYEGKLSNDGEKLELAKAGDVDSEGKRYYVRVERVAYNDTGDWPISPDGQGDSLTRIMYSEYGNDPINWQPAAPTPWQ